MNKLLKKIVNGEFINVIYNGDIYLLVDEFICDKKHVIYFNSLNSELFCYKKDDGYEVIKEKKLIEKVKEENGLYKDEYLYRSKFNTVNNEKNVVEITGGERQLIIETFLDKLITKIPRDVLKNKLNDLRIKRINKLKYLGIRGNSSVYHIRSNTVLLRSDEKESTIFHELLHALTGKDSFIFNSLLGIGLVEGIAENKTIETYQKNVSSSYKGYEYNFDTHDAGPYIENACVTSQLEYILGENLTDSLINKDSKFIEKFYRKYGLNTYLVLRYKLNKICRNSRKQQNNEFLLDEVQDLLLRSVFDKEFESVVDEKTASKYFDSLNTFGLFRARKDREDNLLRIYFNSKKEECSKKLNSSLDNINYEPVKFKNRYLPQEYDLRILKDVRSYLSLNYKPGDVINVYKLQQDDVCYAVVYKNNFQVMKKVYDLNDSKKYHGDVNVSDFEEIFINEKEKQL